MHMYNDFVKGFLCKSVHRLQSRKKLTKLNMSSILHVDPRSYADIAKSQTGNTVFLRPLSCSCSPIWRTLRF